MANWINFYQYKNSDSYKYYISEKYKPFIDILIPYVKNGTKITEVGSGLGTITHLLNASSKTTLIDKNQQMLNITSLKCPKICRDVTKPFNNKYDLIHSHGLLEHLTDNQIKETVRNQLRVCHTLVHYVPTNKYNYVSFGDERLMSPKQWYSLVQPTSMIEFNKGKDLILIWRK